MKFPFMSYNLETTSSLREFELRWERGVEEEGRSSTSKLSRRRMCKERIIENRLGGGGSERRRKMKRRMIRQ